MNYFLSLLGKKYFSVFCLLLAIGCRVVSIFYSSFAGRDKMRLVLQSKNFLEGKGLSVQQYFIDNTEIPVYDYAQLWPPGYPLFLAPFLKIFRYDIYWSITTVDLITAITLIFVVRKICRQCGFTVAAINIITLITGCFEYPFISDSQPTDTISLLFFLIGISLTLKTITANKYSLGQIFFSGFFLFLPNFFRYAYPPLSVAIPIIIVLWGWKMKNSQLVKKGLWIGTITILFMAILFFGLKIFTGQTAYITPTERGFFPKNIIHWYPIIPASFIDLPFFTSQVIKHTGITLAIQLRILEILNVFAILVLNVLFIRCLFIKRSFRKPSPVKWAIFWGWACSILVFLSLGYLSFTYQLQTRITTFWNYIYEARYFAFVILFLQLLFIGWIFITENWKKYLWQKSIIIFCSVMLLIEVLHSIYFYTKASFDFKTYKSGIYKEQDYAFFNSLLMEVKRNNPGYRILAAAPGGDTYYAYTACFFNEKGIFDAHNLKTKLPKIKEKALMIVMLYDTELASYKSLINDPEFRFIQRINYSNFYICEL